jgi:hypothetical protein
VWACPIIRGQQISRITQIPSKFAKYNTLEKNHVYGISDLPANVYKEEVIRNCSNVINPSVLPRNNQWIINLQQHEQQNKRITHDTMYNLHELSYDLKGFVKVITTNPDSLVVCRLIYLHIRIYFDILH